MSGFCEGIRSKSAVYCRRKVKRLFSEEGLLEDIVQSVSHDEDQMGELVNEFAEGIVAILKKDANFKRKILESAILNPKFEEDVIQKIRKQ